MAKDGGVDELADKMSKALQLDPSGQLLDMEEVVYKASPAELDSLRRQILHQQTLSGFDDEGLVKRFVQATKPKEENGAGDNCSFFNCFQNQIMMPTVTDSFDQLPKDLQSDWLSLVCPEGTRVLVIAAHNSTRVYDLEGTWICEHDTHLPGGSPNNISRLEDDVQCTILDCLYNNEQEIYYVVDILCWKGDSFYKYETSVRMPAIADKLNQIPTLKVITQTNPFRFHGLPLSLSCQKNVISSNISTAPFEMTGLLFYHKQALYLPGLSPLGVWVETGCIKHVLGIDVSKLEFRKEMPGKRDWRKNRYEMNPDQETYPKCRPNRNKKGGQHQTQNQNQNQSQNQPQCQAQFEPQNQAQFEPQYPTQYDPQYPTQYDPQYPTQYDPQYPTQYDPQYPTQNDPQYHPQYPTQNDPQYQSQYQPQYQTQYEAQYQAQFEPQDQMQYEPQYQNCQHQTQYQSQYQPHYQTQYEPQYQNQYHTHQFQNYPNNFNSPFADYAGGYGAYNANYQQHQQFYHPQQQTYNQDTYDNMKYHQNKKGGYDAPLKKIMLSVPVPDDRPNWDEWERHEVMMSVTMEFIPENFAEKYLAVICPVAKRRIVVSYLGWTCSYNKLMNMDRKFQSTLPGGNVRSVQVVKNNDICILDCLHLKAERTFYMLDLMHWKQLPYYQSDAEFRFHWINQTENEMDLTSIHKENEYQFKSMPRVKCTEEALFEALEKTSFKVDGVLFFHKEGNYVPGTSSNVLWLPPEDVEKVLGWKLPENLQASKKAKAAPAPAATTSTSTPTTSTSTSTSSQKEGGTDQNGKEVAQTVPPGPSGDHAASAAGASAAPAVVEMESYSTQEATSAEVAYATAETVPSSSDSSAVAGGVESTKGEASAEQVPQSS